VFEGSDHMTDNNNLYDRDFVAWTEQQADALRSAARGATNLTLDWENLAEEVESLGRSDRRELRSQLYRIIRHLAKLQFSPAAEPRRGWRESIIDGRAEVELLLADSPSLRPQLEAFVADGTARAIKRALADLTEFGDIDAVRRGALSAAHYTVDEVLGDWFPPQPGNRSGVR